jgi:hypothetical protein
MSRLLQCEFRGSYYGDYEDCSFLGCDAMECGMFTTLLLRESQDLLDTY